MFRFNLDPYQVKTLNNDRACPSMDLSRKSLKHMLIQSIGKYCIELTGRYFFVKQASKLGLEQQLQFSKGYCDQKFCLSVAYWEAPKVKTWEIHGFLDYMDKNTIKGCNYKVISMVLISSAWKPTMSTKSVEDPVNFHNNHQAIPNTFVTFDCMANLWGLNTSLQSPTYYLFCNIEENTFTDHINIIKQKEWKLINTYIA